MVLDLTIPNLGNAWFWQGRARSWGDPWLVLDLTVPDLSHRW